MPKTLMPYLSLFYGFSFILQLNTHFIARYLIRAFCVNSRWNGQFLGPFWSREKKSRKLTGTSRRPNVTTSGQQEEEVKKWPTSRRLNVATPQRRDASTSLRLNVATPQCREIEWGIEKRMD